MKRIFSLLLAAVLLASLPACRGTAQPQPSGSGPAATEVVSALMLASGYTGQVENLVYMNAGGQGSELLPDYLENVYGLSDGDWADAAVIYETGASAFELAVLRLENENEAARAAALFTAYLEGREGDFTGYAPKQAAMVANSVSACIGVYAVLCICPDPDQAVKAFRSSVEGGNLTGLPDILPTAAATDQADPGEYETPKPQETQYAATYPGRCDFIQPNKDDMSVYDTSAILDAWKLGDPTSLSGYDKDIYNAAKQVLDEVLRDGMSGLEKETAVYYWIVRNVNYDWTHTHDNEETLRESFTPYGGLVNHTAVCLGYATTFQLLMDLAGVECITVLGAAYSSTEDHGWNMVRLNGNWYCVDVTWDANWREEYQRYGIFWGRERDWNYFNVTSDYMAAEHQWDYAHVPEAVTRGNGRS